MNLNKLAPVLVLLLTAVGMLAIGMEDVSAQSSRFDSGDSQDDANTGTQDGSDTDAGSNQDVEDSSTGSDSNSDRFDSGDNQDDANTDTQDQPDNQLSNTQDDSSRFDSGDSQDDTNVDAEPDNQQDTQNQQGSEGAGGGGGSFISIESLNISDEQLSVQVSPNSVPQGQEATISGSVDTDEDVRNLAVSIFLNGQNIDTVRMDEDGTYSTTFTPNESGTIRAEFQGARATTSFNVGGESQLTIQDTTISGGNSAGQNVEVCSQIQSAQNAEVEFYVDGQLEDSTTGTGEVCFDTTLQSGTNEYEVVAILGETTVRDSVVRNTDTPTTPFQPNNDQQPDQGITGDFTANMPNFSNMVNDGFVNSVSNSLLWMVSIIAGLALTGLILL